MFRVVWRPTAEADSRMILGLFYNKADAESFIELDIVEDIRLGFNADESRYIIEEVDHV